MKGILFATSNPGKVKEAQAILKIPLEIANIEIDEIQSMNLEEVAKKKVETAYKILKRPVIVDDVGVFMEAWNGFPGPLVKFILATLGNKGVLDLMKKEPNRNLVVKSAIGYHDGKRSHVFIGEVKGNLAFEERGSEGWGFDFCIIPNGHYKTYAEMGSAGKNELSHRKNALDKLKAYLDSQKG